MEEETERKYGEEEPLYTALGIREVHEVLMELARLE